MKIVLSSLAARELIEESGKYEEKAPNFGSIFIDEFEVSVRLLQEFPEAGHVFGAHFRRVLMKRFPFSVIYAVSGGLVRIVAIMHQHRGPEFIAKRLEMDSAGSDC